MKFPNTNHSGISFKKLDNNKDDDNLTKQIVSFKAGELRLREVYGNAKLLEEEGKNRLDRHGFLIDDLIRKDYVKKGELWASFALKRMKYTNDYLDKISSLLSHSKHYENYSRQRKHVQSGKTNGILKDKDKGNCIGGISESKSTMNMSLSSKPHPSLMCPSRTRNCSAMNSTFAKSMYGNMNRNTRIRYYNNNNNNNNFSNLSNVNAESKYIIDDTLSDEDDVLRFDLGADEYRKKMFEKLDNENKFYKRKKDKNAHANINPFDLIKEKVFKNKNPIDKSTYLRNEYFNTRSSFNKTFHLIQMKDMKKTMNRNIRNFDNITARNASYDLSKSFKSKVIVLNKCKPHIQRLISNKKTNDG